MKNLLLISTLIIINFFIGNLVLAGCVCNGNPVNYTQTVCNTISTCVWQADPSSTPGTGSNNTTVFLVNPLGGNQATPKGQTDIPTLLGKIINSILGVVGSLALVMFIYGGVIWMLSAGNQEQVTKGKNILIWATIGIVIIFTAYALVRFLLTTVTMAPQ